MTENKILKKNLQAMGFSSLSHVQKESIPTFKKGRNLLVLAETGSGKTAAYLIPILESPTPLTVVIAPTRELVRQIQEVGKGMAQSLDVSLHRFHGQENADKQIQSLKASEAQSKIVIATPGRLLDLLTNGRLSLDRCDYFVLDEVDELLERGFIEEIEKIMHYLPQKTHLSAYSATEGEEVQKILNKTFGAYQKINLLNAKREDARFETENIPTESKEQWLSRFILDHVYDSFLVFVSSREKAHRLNRNLEKRKIRTVALHGNMSQRQRNQSIEAFIAYEAQVLVATDLASRGLDLPEIDYVVNYDLPQSVDVYEHRIGRTARFDQKGHVLNLYQSREVAHLRYLLKEFNKNAS